jgi:hypothetical protein
MPVIRQGIYRMQYLTGSGTIIMYKPYRILASFLLLAFCVNAASAQRSRTVGETSRGNDAQPAATSETVKAKYEGGLFGYSKKVDGTLVFDDASRRLLFRKKDQTEMLSISYDAIVAASAETQSKRPKVTDAIGGVSILTMPAKLIKKKFRYLVLQYKDPDTEASGTTSFKLENKEALAAMLSTLASKAGLTSRGEIYVRQRDASSPGSSR